MDAREKVKLLVRACKTLGFAVMSRDRIWPDDREEWWLETAEPFPRDRKSVWLDGEHTFESAEKLLAKFLDVHGFWFPAYVSGVPISGSVRGKLLDNPFCKWSEEKLAIALDLFQGESISQESALGKRGRE